MSGHYDLLIRNASIVDGTGDPRFAGDIGIRGDRIARIGQLAGALGTQEIDLGGRVAAPGFIDAHTHDDRLLLSGSSMLPKISQGVTTVIGGNCGVSLAPMPRRIPNPVTPPLNLLDDSGGWFKFPRFADYLDALRAEPAATNCAMLVGHITLRVSTMDDLSRPADAKEIAAMQGLVEEALSAGAIGVSTGLFYESAFAATAEEVIEVCRPLAAHRGIYCTHMRDEAGQVFDALEETFRIARELGVSQEEAVARLSPAGAIYFMMDEDDVQRILKFAPTMIGSDGLPHDAAPHPRLWGTFPRVLGHYGRLLGLFSLETAVHKMTGLTARNFGLPDRGVLKEGAYADLALFDSATVDAASTYESPLAPAKGIETVIVNGAIVWRAGRATGARPGRVLSHAA